MDVKCMLFASGYAAKGLRHNTGLVKLSLRQCYLQLTEGNGPLLAMEEMLRENRTLKELDLADNPIGPTALGYIAKGLRHNTGLVKLSLQKCGLQLTEGIGPLLEEMLRENRTLKEVNLFNNVLGKHADALGYIAKGLRYNTGLVKLLLEKCFLNGTEDNSQLFEETLGENRTLKELDLADNPIGPTGLGYIAKGLRHNTGLMKLSLQRCDVRVTGRNGPLLVEMLKRNSTLEELDISGSYGITNTGLLTLGKGLKTNRGLKTLNLTTLPEVTRKGWRQFMLCLKENNHLTKLQIPQKESAVLPQEMQAVNEAQRRQGLPPLVQCS